MADKHPYMSGSAGLIQAINQFRKSFPNQIAAETLKKLGIAPNNETYVINILRFVQLLDSEGKKTDKAAAAFSQHLDADFQASLSELIEEGYRDLFDLHGKDAWSLSGDKLISFFRSTDHTSSIVGQRQASTFQALAALAGHAEVAAPKQSTGTKVSSKTVSKKTPAPPKSDKEPIHAPLEGAKDKTLKPNDFGLSVRIEINLPTAPDQETYDRIFRSIKENLLNG